MALPDPRSPERQSPITFRMSAEERAALDALTAAEGCDMSTVMREALRPRLEPFLQRTA